MENVNCCICAESFNHSNRREVKCEYCDFVACRTCFETYLLSQTTSHCMLSNEQCGKIWTRQFISNNFTMAFVNHKYKEHRERILFEQELSLMPATQLIIERRKYKKQKLADYSRELKDLNDYIWQLTIRKNALEHNIRRLKLIENNDDIYDDIYTDDSNEFKSDSVKSTKKFMHRCSNENCRGFLSSNWNCELCDKWTCSKCYMNIGTTEDKNDHVCNENDVETAKLIKKDSKPCPKCGIIIFKIDGCDQMYCTQCHTPFSWKTGNIETSRNIHNPHYFEYIRTHGNIPLARNPNDIVCGRDLNRNFVSTFNDLLVYLFDDKMRDTIINMCKNISSYDVYINDYRNSIDRNEDKKKEHRIKYLTNEISEEYFKRKVQMNDKKNQQDREIMDIFVMLRDANIDMMYLINDKLEEVEKVLKFVSSGTYKRVVEMRYSCYGNGNYAYQKYIDDIIPKRNIEFEKNNLDLNIIFTEFNNLREYANNCFREISKTYNSSSCKQICEEFNVKKEYNFKHKKVRVTKNNNDATQQPQTEEVESS